MGKETVEEIVVVFGLGQSHYYRDVEIFYSDEETIQIHHKGTNVIIEEYDRKSVSKIFKAGERLV